MPKFPAILPPWFIGEFLGTFLIILFGCGSGAASLLMVSGGGIPFVPIAWGLSVAAAICLFGPMSGAHMNPAVTLSLATTRGFPWGRVPGYILAQLLGAFAASGVVYAVFSGLLRTFEAGIHVVRGLAGSEASAMIFGEFYPNPGGRPLSAHEGALLSMGSAFSFEVLGTAVLVLAVLLLTQERHASRPRILTAAAIGFTVTVLISLLGPLTMACLNPARDFGPRAFSSLAGWGGTVFRANGSGWLVVYIAAPIVGGQIGALAYRLLVRTGRQAERGASASLP